MPLHAAFFPKDLLYHQSLNNIDVFELCAEVFSQHDLFLFIAGLVTWEFQKETQPHDIFLMMDI
jgi:hypothetical protein